MTKLGIIGAMDIEVESLKKQLQNLTVTEKAGSDFYAGTLRGLPVVVVRCGIGKVNAAICAQILCDLFQVTHIINTGIAGSLDAVLDIGDLVVSDQVIHHDFDCFHFGYPHCTIPGMPTGFPADENLMAMAVAAAQQVHPDHVRVGTVASGDQFIADPKLKNSIIEKTGAQCTEMEGAAIAQTAYRNNVPFVILRAISDKADDSAEMDYPTFEALAAQRCAAVVMALAEKLC